MADKFYIIATQSTLQGEGGGTPKYSFEVCLEFPLNQLPKSNEKLISWTVRPFEKKIVFVCQENHSRAKAISLKLVFMISHNV